MAKKFRQEGKTRNITPGTDIASGDFVASGSKVGVALADIPANTLGTLYLVGVWQMNATGHGLDVGDDVKVNLTTQAYDAANGVSVGEVHEVVNANTIDVLINGLPGTASTV